MAAARPRLTHPSTGNEIPASSSRSSPFGCVSASPVLPPGAGTSAGAAGLDTELLGSGVLEPDVPGAGVLGAVLLGAGVALPGGADDGLDGTPLGPPPGAGSVPPGAAGAGSPGAGLPGAGSAGAAGAASRAGSASTHPTWISSGSVSA